MIATLMGAHPVLQGLLLVGVLALIPKFAGAVDLVKGQPRADGGEYGPYRKKRVKQIYTVVGVLALATVAVYLIP